MTEVEAFAVELNYYCCHLKPDLDAWAISSWVEARIKQYASELAGVPYNHAAASAIEAEQLLRKELARLQTTPKEPYGSIYE
jgi:hypothetical protein